MHYRRRASVLSVIAVLSCDLSARAASTPVILKPSSKWFVNYGDDSCRLAREFGSDDTKLTVIIERFGPGESFNLALVGKLMRSQTDSDPAHLRFGASENVQKIRYFSGNFGPDKPAMIFRETIWIAGLTDDDVKAMKAARTSGVSFEPQIGPAREAAVTFLQVGSPLHKPILIETGSMGKPFEAMRQCIDNLITTWGVDPQKLALQSKAVVAERPDKWLSFADYPTLAVMSGTRGIVRFRLSVDAAGKATACHIQQSTSAKDFDAAVCGALMRRAKFQPALDNKGIPMASFYRSSVIFDLPNSPAE